MPQKLFLSAAAEADIDEIVSYIAEENPNAARKFLDAVFDAMNNLTEFPDLGHFRNDITDKNVKFLPFKWHYFIIYKPAVPIEIVRVLSGYRDIVNIIGDNDYQEQEGLQGISTVNEPVFTIYQTC